MTRSSIGNRRASVGSGRASFGIGLATVLLLGTLAVGPAWALEDQDRAQDGVRDGQIRPFAQIKSNLERRFGGRVIDVRMPSKGEYLVKLLTSDGDVIVVQADPRTGRVLGVRGGR